MGGKPSGEYVPGTQEVRHSNAPAKDDFPAGQFTHLTPPTGTYCEAGHAVQSEPEPEPSVGIYLPGGQLMQALTPAGAKVDWGHTSH